MQTLTKELLGQLRARLGEQNFQTWISPIRLTDWRDGVLTIEVPSKFFRDWLDEHFRGLIAETGRGIMNRPVAVTFQIGAPELLAEASWIFKAHMVLGMSIFLIFPFTRLVHVWSGLASVAYVLRPYQLVRSRRLHASAKQKPAHGKEGQA